MLEAVLHLFGLGGQPSEVRRVRHSSMTRSRGVRSAGATKDADDSESVLRLFEDLSISSVADDRIVSLSELDRQLQNWYHYEFTPGV